MSIKHTISINGKLYDAQTGLMIESNPQTHATTSVPKSHTTQPTKATVHRDQSHKSGDIHRQTQKSTTLRRNHLKAPKSTAPTAPARRQAGHVARSPHITHFAAHPTPLPKQRVPRQINDIGPVVRQAVVAPSTKARLSSVEVKERLIAKAGDTVATQKEPASKQKKRFADRFKLRHFITAGIAGIVLMGYLVYLNVPNLSIRIAAAQSGVDASYPQYSPDGYSFQGPIAFRQGEVELHFTSNGGGRGYTISQQNSSWNSVAVLDNLVKKASNGEYQVNSQGGVTIYTYGTNAAWTNGGVLYTVDGDAPLSSEQIQKIATSL